MKHTGVAIYVNAGSIPPEEYIKRALDENKSCIGAAALVTKPGEQPFFQVESFSQTVPLQSLMGLLTNFKDCEVLLHLGNADTKVLKEDLQPFVALRDKEEKIIAVGAIEGTWYPTKRDDTNKDNTEEGLLVRDYLEPKLAKLFKLADHDIGGFFKELKAKDTEDDLKAKWDKHGSMIFLGVNGEVGRVDHNASFRKYDWGFVTKHYSYKAEELKVEEKITENSSMFGMPIADTAPMQQPAKDPNKELKLGEPTPVVGNIKTELKGSAATPAPAVEKNGKPAKWVRPPLSSMGKRNDIRKFYDRCLGHNDRPSNFMEGPAVLVTLERLEEKDIKGYREVTGPNGVVIPRTPDKTSVPSISPAPATVPEEPKKEVVPDPMKKEEVELVHDGSKPVKPTLSLMPIISAENKMKINARLLAIKSNTAKTVGIGSQEPPIAPSKIQGVENTLKNFTEQLGIKREDLFMLSFPDIVGLCRDFPDDMAVLLSNLLNSASKIGLKPKEEEIKEVGKNGGPILEDNPGMFGQSMKA